MPPAGFPGGSRTLVSGICPEYPIELEEGHPTQPVKQGRNPNRVVVRQKREKSTYVIEWISHELGTLS